MQASICVSAANPAKQNLSAIKNHVINKIASIDAAAVAHYNSNGSRLKIIFPATMNTHHPWMPPWSPHMSATTGKFFVFFCYFILFYFIFV
jgi:hypothetical protein